MSDERDSVIAEMAEVAKEELSGASMDDAIVSVGCLVNRYVQEHRLAREGAQDAYDEVFGAIEPLIGATAESVQKEAEVAEVETEISEEPEEVEASLEEKEGCGEKPKPPRRKRQKKAVPNAPHKTAAGDTGDYEIHITGEEADILRNVIELADIETPQDEEGEVYMQNVDEAYNAIVDQWGRAGDGDEYVFQFSARALDAILNELEMGSIEDWGDWDEPEYAGKCEALGLKIENQTSGKQAPHRTTGEEKCPECGGDTEPIEDEDGVVHGWECLECGHGENDHRASRRTAKEGENYQTFIDANKELYEGLLQKGLDGGISFEDAAKTLEEKAYEFGTESWEIEALIDAFRDDMDFGEGRGEYSEASRKQAGEQTIFDRETVQEPRVMVEKIIGPNPIDQYASSTMARGAVQYGPKMYTWTVKWAGSNPDEEWRGSTALFERMMMDYMTQDDFRVVDDAIREACKKGEVTESKVEEQLAKSQERAKRQVDQSIKGKDSWDPETKGDPFEYKYARRRRGGRPFRREAKTTICPKCGEETLKWMGKGYPRCKNCGIVPIHSKSPKVQREELGLDDKRESSRRTANRIDDAIARYEQKIADADPEKVEKLTASLEDLPLNEMAAYQEEKSLACAEGKLTTEEGMRLYRILNGWGSSTLAEKIVTTQIMGELIEGRLKGMGSREKPYEDGATGEELQKAFNELPSVKCEQCGKELGPEQFLSKWNVCGDCTKENQQRVTRGGSRKKARNYDRAETESGNCVVYHKDDSGCPECHDEESGDPTDDDGRSGPWFFEPIDWDTNEVFSFGYPSLEDALEAAEDFEVEEEGYKKEEQLYQEEMEQQEVGRYEASRKIADIDAVNMVIKKGDQLITKMKNKARRGQFHEQFGQKELRQFDDWVWELRANPDLSDWEANKIGEICTQVRDIVEGMDLGALGAKATCPNCGGPKVTEGELCPKCGIPVPEYRDVWDEPAYTAPKESRRAEADKEVVMDEKMERIIARAARKAAREVLGAAGADQFRRYDAPAEGGPDKKVQGVRVVAQVDEYPDASYLEQEYGDVEDEEERERYKGEDKERLENLGVTWDYVFIYAEAQILIRRGNSWLTQRVQSGGLGGVESDSGEGYLQEIRGEELSELHDVLVSFGFSEEEIDEAFVNSQDVGF